MGRARKAKKVATAKRISLRDPRIKKQAAASKSPAAKSSNNSKDEIDVRHVTKHSSALYFRYNTELGPPFHILLDTNFINFSIKNKLDVMTSLMDCLYAKCIPYLTDCVVGELEKMGQRYRVALKICRDARFERLKCSHKGTYADDCLVNRVQAHKCYIVATCDRDLQRRIRKIPGVPIMYVKSRRYAVERMPDAYGAPQ